jgi:hypothetical protein
VKRPFSRVIKCFEKPAKAEKKESLKKAKRRK